MYKKLKVFTKTTDFGQATKLVEVPLKEPNEEQVRVRNIYAGVNATDINITAARYFTDGELPFDVGLEGLGIVDDIGSRVTSFHKGQPVLVMKKKNMDCFSEYIYSTADDLVALPDLKPNYLVAFINGLTATIGLDKAGRIQSGEKVLITAAAGGTGQIAVQWAKHRGAYVIAMTSSEKKVEYLKKLGADFIVNYRTENLDQVLTKNFPNGIDVIWETMGGKTFVTLYNHLSIRGRMILIGSITNYKDKSITSESIDNLYLDLLMGSKSLNGFMLLNYMEFFSEYLHELIDKIHKGEIQALVDLGETTSEGKFFGLDQVWRAEEHLHNGKNIGKVIVQVQEP